MVASLIKVDQMRALAAELCPLMYDAPARDRRGNNTTLLDYVCTVAARAASALANSTNADEIALVWNVADAHTPTKAPGPGCANLIEYACACANGFNTPIGIEFPPTNAPQRVLGIVLAIRFKKDIDAIGTGVRTKDGKLKPSALAKTAADKAVSLAIAKIRPLLVAAGIAEEADLPTGVAAKAAAAYDLYKGKGAALQAARKAMTLAEYEPESVKAFAAGLLVPLAGEEKSTFAALIPKGLGGFTTILKTLWEVAGAEAEAAEGGEKVKTSSSSAIEGGSNLAKALFEATSATLEGAKSLELFAKGPEGELLSFGEGAEVLVKVLGRTSFLLGAVSETVQVWDAAKDKQWSDSNRTWPRHRRIRVPLRRQRRGGPRLRRNRDGPLDWRRRPHERGSLRRAAQGEDGRGVRGNHARTRHGEALRAGEKEGGDGASGGVHRQELGG